MYEVECDLWCWTLGAVTFCFNHDGTAAAPFFNYRDLLYKSATQPVVWDLHKGLSGRWSLQIKSKSGKKTQTVWAARRFAPELKATPAASRLDLKQVCGFLPAGQGVHSGGGPRGRDSSKTCLRWPRTGWSRTDPRGAAVGPSPSSLISPWVFLLGGVQRGER